MAIELNNDSDHSSCGVLCQYLKIIFVLHCPSESLWLLGIQWSIPNVAMIMMNEPIIPDWKASYLAPASPAPPPKSFQKTRIVVVLVSWVCFIPWQHIFLKTVPTHAHTHASARVKLVDFQSKEELLEAVPHPNFAIFPATPATTQPLGKRIINLRWSVSSYPKLIILYTGSSNKENHPF